MKVILVCLCVSIHQARFIRCVFNLIFDNTRWKIGHGFAYVQLKRRQE